MARKRYFTTVAGKKWAFLKYGQGRPLMLLHGLLNYADYFHPLASMLADDFEVIVPDLPGFGYSEKLKSNTYWELADSVAGFTKALGYQKMDYFGVSMGGTLLLEYGLLRKELVNKIVVQSPLWRKGGIQFNALEKIEIKFSNLPSPILKFAQKPRILKLFFRWAEFVKPDLHKLFSLYSNEITEAISLLDPAAAKQLFASMLHIKLDQRVAEMSCPLLMIVGDKDVVISPEETFALAKKVKRDLTVVVKNEDHEILLDAPDKLAKILKSYLINGETASDQELTWRKI